MQIEKERGIRFMLIITGVAVSVLIADIAVKNNDQKHIKAKESLYKRIDDKTKEINRLKLELENVVDRQELEALIEKKIREYSNK
mgnify:CR=1 FL=1|tara:strand:+ start:70760 stop:71014 length:255 start_codon:yes stop_codon:yes gene_type:complete